MLNNHIVYTAQQESGSPTVLANGYRVHVNHTNTPTQRLVGVCLFAGGRQVAWALPRRAAT